MSDKLCDNTSVGVIISNADGQILLLERRKFPPGMAAPAGHIDDFGDAQRAALEEVWEEVGIRLDPGQLHKTLISKRRVDNQCRRTGGDHHFWTVYTANVGTVEIIPSTDETKGAAWYDLPAIREFIVRGQVRATGTINEAEWLANPGMEQIWADFFVELGIVDVVKDRESPS